MRAALPERPQTGSGSFDGRNGRESLCLLMMPWRIQQELILARSVLAGQHDLLSCSAALVHWRMEPCTENAAFERLNSEVRS